MLKSHACVKSCCVIKPPCSVSITLAGNVVVSFNVSDGARRNCWGARAVKGPTVSGVQDSLQTMPIVLPPKKSKKNEKVPDFMKCRRSMKI